MAETRYGGRKTRVGVVVSDKMQKTVVVAVESFKRHRLYRKSVRRVKRYKAHDAENTCRVGDKVLIVETRPLSRDKRWRVVEVLATAAIPQEETVAELRELEEEAVVGQATPVAAEEPVQPAVPVAEPAAGQAAAAAVEEVALPEEIAAAEPEAAPAAEEEPVAVAETEPAATEEPTAAEEPTALAPNEPPAGEPKTKKRKETEES